VAAAAHQGETLLNRKVLLLVLTSLLAVGACSSKRAQTDAGAGETVGAESGAGADTSGVTTVTAGEGSNSGALGPGGALGSQRVIYFDFDSSEIRGEYVDVIAAHGRFLASNATVRVRHEGHSDERGSREYNIGLGERRAQAVRRALMLQGVADTQITTVSYGEERPAVAGSDETAYARNRRVELVYGR
jgi:peptidoglycan-associated lipoprotein